MIPHPHHKALIKKCSALFLLSMVTNSLDASQLRTSQQVPAGYAEISRDKEVPGKHKYTGLKVYREYTTKIHWQHPTNPGQPFSNTVRSDKEGPIEGHDGRIVLFAQPFRTHDKLVTPDQRNNFIGLYQYQSDLVDDKKIAFGPLFYKPDNEDAIYHVYLTQQRWERIDHTIVDFLIASYKAGEKIKFIDEASTSGGLILNDNLHKLSGLYQLIAVDNEPSPGDVPSPVVGVRGAHPKKTNTPQWTDRWEQWKRLENDATLDEPVIEIRAPHGVLSIPGIGLFALNEIQEVEEDEINKLKKEKECADADVDLIISQAGASVGTLIITGPTGCGKTTFINCYELNQSGSREREDGTGWELYFRHPLANFTVGSKGHAQTNRPAFYSDLQNELVLCDNPGDDDTNGPLRDVVNAAMTYRIFKNPAGVKLLLAAEESLIKTSRGGYFIKALEDVINSFNDDTTLHQMMHLMISKRTNLNIQKYLKSLIGDPTADPPVPEDAKLNGKPRLASLIKYLVDNPERVSTSAVAPTGEEGEEIPFERDVNEARASILSGPFVTNPNVKLKIKDASHHLVQGLARSLNEDMVKYLRTTGAQKIIEYCSRKIEDHNSSADELRDVFAKLATRLKGIKQLGSPEDFLNVFDGVPATTGTKQYLLYLMQAK